MISSFSLQAMSALQEKPIAEIRRGELRNEYKESGSFSIISGDKSDRSHVVLWAKELTRDFVFLRPPWPPT